MADEPLIEEVEGVVEAAEPTVEELLKELLKAQQEHRAEVNALREEINKAKAPVQYGSKILTPEELLANRMAEIAEHDFYCPGCGRLYDYLTECKGGEEAPHPAIQVVSTDELKTGDPAKHTPAPNTDKAPPRR